MFKKIIGLIFLLGIIALIAGPIYIVNALGKPAGTSTTEASFKVEQGESLVDIAGDLKGQNLIKNQLAFITYIKFKGSYIKAGSYELSPSLNLKAVADILSGGQVMAVKVTIPEGWRAEQIAQRLAGKGLIKFDDFINAAYGNDGYLFPDTYEFKSDVTAEEIVDKMVQNFNRRTRGLNVSTDDLKLASIIEREAKLDVDRPKIAQVYLNRLNHNMKLEADPTVQYAKDNSRFQEVSAADVLDFKFWAPITSADYKTVDSTFNTYLFPSLPPAPICNPGLKSISGALNPEEHNYFYFLQTSDGATYYGRNAAEHETNKNKYLR